jgi:hypothetical protein
VTWRLAIFVGSVAMVATPFGSALASGRTSEFRELYRGARAQAMGNAFTAVADDEQAIFLNPAGLGGPKKYVLNYAVAGVEISGDIIFSALEGLEAFNNLSGDGLNAVIGRNIFGHAQITPSLQMGNLGIGVIIDSQVALISKNLAMPQITLGYQFTNGIQLAYGTSLRRTRVEGKDDLRVGVGAKILWRRGGYNLLSLTDLFSVNESTLKDLAGSYQRGIGFDLGAQYIKHFKQRFALSAGVAMTEIGDINFGGQADSQQGNLSAGVALAYRLPRLTTTLAYDFRNIFRVGDWRKKNHLGLEMAMPFISLYGGINQISLTYGLSFDAWLFRVTALSYAEEQGAFAYQESERRYMLQIGLKLGI